MSQPVTGDVAFLRSEMYSPNPLYLTVGAKIYNTTDPDGSVLVHWVRNEEVQTAVIHEKTLVTLTEMEEILQDSKSR